MKDLDFFTPGARLALELECLLLDTRNDAAQSRWWDSAHEALEQWRQAVLAMEAADAAPQQPAASSETVNVIGMPEFDGLLDHIYEHGTAAEGAIEKANAFARAVIARYAPQQPEASTTLNEAESHAHICFKLAEQYKSDPVLFAALTDAAAIIRDLLRDRLGASATGAGQAEIEALRKRRPSGPVANGYCHYCDKTNDLRPYGPKGAMVCFNCAMSTPERKAETEHNFAVQLDAAGPVAMIDGTEVGPYPAKHAKATRGEQ